MILTVLVDNNTYIDKYYLGEPGVSYYIEDEGTKIIFDTGYSDIYLKNAKKMGIDVSLTDKIIISHGHNDHTGGLQYFPIPEKKPRLIAHPNILEEKECDALKVGCPDIVLEDKFELNLTSKPLRVSPNIIFLGEIERSNDFENKIPVGERLLADGRKADFLIDDSALVYDSGDGIYIITGCSHAGICNIISYAKKITGRSKVKGVIGGFHLFDPDSLQTKNTIEFLKKENISELYPCHCTSFAARCALNEKIHVKEAGVSLKLIWE